MINCREAKMEKYCPPLEGRRGKLRLDFNENTIGCSPKVIEALRNISMEDISVYPEYSMFKEKFANYLCISAEQLVLTNGADEAIKVIMDTYLDKGEEIIIPTPTFSMFKVYASIMGAKINSILYNNDLSFPTDKVLGQINEKTRMVILVNPNNPTGTTIKEEDIVRILDKARTSIVIIDEAYFQYYGKSSKELIDRYDNLIIIQTFSKAFGLAGLRLGYIISNNALINNIDKVQSPYSVNNLALIAGSAALDDLEFVNNYVNEIRKSKKFVYGELARLGIKTFDSDANFIIACFGDKCDNVLSGLRNKNILVRDMRKYPLLNGCLRLGIGTKEQCVSLVGGIKQIIRNKVILFDLDGVLVNVSNSYRLAIKKTAEFFTKKEIDLAIIQQFKEKGGYNNDWDLTEAIILGCGIKITKNDIINKFQEVYLGGLIDNETWLLDKNLLNQLYKQYNLGIVTGRPKDEAYYVLKKFDMLEFFDVVITIDDCQGKLKPDPFGILLALEKLEKKDAIYVGDSVDDIKAAKNAEIQPIGIVPPSLNTDKLRQLLKDNGAKNVLDEVNDIMVMVQ